MHPHHTVRLKNKLFVKKRAAERREDVGDADEPMQKEEKKRQANQMIGFIPENQSIKVVAILVDKRGPTKIWPQLTFVASTLGNKTCHS